ncbi:MAG: restriction endonuclease [Planctomycetota bacterium]|jgi:hypothetical protein
MPDASKQFEKDVWRFVKTLDQTAEVLFDQKIADKDTGSLRQVDAWINAKLGGHIPVSILVSCKNHRRKLDITHIESFAAEVRATRASTGIIYSSSGFTKPAIKKAKSYGLPCCRLFRSEPGELPKSLVFWHYACYPRVRLNIPDTEVKKLMEKNIRDWSSLLRIRTTERNFLVDEVAQEFAKHEDWCIQQSRINTDCVVPQDWKVECTISSNEDPSLEFKLHLIGYWEIYRARLEYYILNGSYCYSNKSFVGSIVTPTLDTQGSHPGSGWEPIKRDEIFSSPIQTAFIFGHGDIKEKLLDYSKHKPISLPNKSSPMARPIPGS